MANEKLYQITPGDLAIFNQVRKTKNLNFFTNYYLRSPSSGTWWRPVADEDMEQLEVPEFRVMAQRWKSGYELLLRTWLDLGKPEFFLEAAQQKYEIITAEQHDEIHDRRKYRALFEPEYDYPIFHHNHGRMFLPWGLEAVQAKQSERVVIGGYGSGKTDNFTMEALVYAAIHAGWRSFALAPYSMQANEVYNKAKEMIAGTLYEERFLIRSPRKPMNHLVIGNSLVGGENTIECYPILESPEKILTVSIDAAMVDQAEQLPDVFEVRRLVSSRFRGHVGGRPRMGTISYVANVADNPSLWDLYDEAETDPRNVWSFSPHSGLNSYLTVKNMIDYQSKVGKTKEERRMFFAGGRPLGSGEYFSREMLERCRATWLDDEMAKHVELETPGWKHYTAHRCGTVKWEMPHDWSADPDAEFIVVADAGTKNPPYRDSAPVAVFRVNGFPFVPAQMVAFTWVSGNGFPDPWMNQYTDYAIRYRAIGRNGFDDTGGRYSKMPTGLQDLLPFPVNLGGTKKLSYITLAQAMMGRGLFQMPYIEHLFAQLAKYDYRDDTPTGKLRQDLVMMILVAVAVLEPRWYVQFNKDESHKEDYDASDRYARPNTGADRWGTHAR